MTHVPFIIAAFSVFVLVLAADALGSWLRLRSARRQAVRRAERLRARDRSTPATPLATELSR
jgi:heme exporter protein D